MIPESESETGDESGWSQTVVVVVVTGRIAGQFGLGQGSTQDDVETPEELEFEGRRESEDGEIITSLSRITPGGIKSIPVDLIAALEGLTVDNLIIGTDGEPLDGGSMSTTVVTSTGGIVNVRNKLLHDLGIKFG